MTVPAARHRTARKLGSEPLSLSNGGIALSLGDRQALTHAGQLGAQADGEISLTLPVLTLVVSVRLSHFRRSALDSYVRKRVYTANSYVRADPIGPFLT